MSQTVADHVDKIRHGWLWIAFAVLLAYWPLTTFQYGLSEGDTLDCWLPWRHFIAASLKDGQMPTWNPLQQMGYPIHADLQGPAWYPEALILGGTIGMGPHVLQLLFLFYLIIGGCGMRLITRELIVNDRAALITGIAYALCGFFTAHAMHFYAVISAAWMPWLLWALLRLLKVPGLRTALIASVFLFLLLTGGNHTFLIIVAWPAMILIAITCWKAWQRGDRYHVRAVLLHGSLAVAAALVMACGTLHALWEVSPYISRVQGLDLASAQREPFTLAALKSVLWPAAAIADADALGTDITMGNGYFGAIMLLFVICGMRYIRGHSLWVFSFFALIAALAAFGPLFPVHGLLWRFVPGMDLFRFPSYFWYFVILFLLPVAGLGVAALLRIEKPHVPMIVTGIFILLSVVMAVRNTWSGMGPDDAPLFVQMRVTAIGTYMTIAGVVLIVMLLLLLVWMRSKRRRWYWLALLVGAEMFFAIQITQWYTTLGSHSPAELTERIDALPVGPIVPRMHPMGMNADDSQVMHLLWRNTQNFQGQPTHGGFNSFWMAAHGRITDDHPQLYAAMLEQPFIYFVDTLMAGIGDRSGGGLHGAPAVLHDATDLPPYGKGAGELRLTAFTYERISLESRSTMDRFMVVQQNQYPGWQISVDGFEVPVIRVNFAAFGAWIPSGDHAIEIHYHKPLLRWLLLFSYITFFSILFWLAWTSGRPIFFMGLVLLLAVLWLWSVYFNIPKADRIADGWSEVVAQRIFSGRHPVLVNTDRPLAKAIPGVQLLRMDVPDDMAPLEAAITALDTQPDTLVLAWHGLPINAASRAWLAALGYSPIARSGNSSAGAWMLARSSQVPPWKELYHDPMDDGLALEASQSPWTKAWRRNVGKLRNEANGKLIIDMHYKGAGAGDALLVIERRRNDLITDHETIPLTSMDRDPQEWHVLQAVRSIPHRRFSGEELGIYILTTGSDTVFVKDLRIHVGELPF